MMIFRRKWPRHGRRPKSVGDASSRVWEATRRVLPGSTRVSRRHRSRCGNGAERRGLFVRPSTILSELQMILAARNETESSQRHHERLYKVCMMPFGFSQHHKTRRGSGKRGRLFVLLDVESRREEETMIKISLSSLVVSCHVFCFISRRRDHSKLP